MPNPKDIAKGRVEMPKGWYKKLVGQFEKEYIANREVHDEYMTLADRVKPVSSHYQEMKDSGICGTT